MKNCLIRTQVYDFITRARSSGLESEWINLINDKQVNQEKLAQLDSLVLNVLRTSPKEISLTRPSISINHHPFTNNAVIEYEIPKEVRESLKQEALKTVSNEDKAKELYRSNLRSLREQLLRQYAVNNPQNVLPPLKTKPVNGILKKSKKPQDINKIIASLNPDPRFPQYDSVIIGLKNALINYRDQTGQSLFEKEIAIHSNYFKKLGTGSINWNLLSESEADFVNVLSKAYSTLEENLILLPHEVPELQYYEVLIEKIRDAEGQKLVEVVESSSAFEKMIEGAKQYHLELAHIHVDQIFKGWPEWQLKLEDLYINKKWFHLLGE